jgi:hypothetical protein
VRKRKLKLGGGAGGAAKSKMKLGGRAGHGAKMGAASKGARRSCTPAKARMCAARRRQRRPHLAARHRPRTEAVLPQPPRCGRARSRNGWRWMTGPAPAPSAATINDARAKNGLPA